MPNFFNKYPYTDFHELNLDWILETVQRISAEWAETLNVWHDTEEEWQQLYNYVHDYFDNLDVQEEVNNKIDAMIADGSLAEVVRPFVESNVATLLPGEVSDRLPAVVSDQIGPIVSDQIGPVVSDQIGTYIPPAVTSWLEDNVTPVGGAVVVDTSLTVGVAAADAEVTGDRIKANLDSITNLDHNHYFEHVGYLKADGTYTTNPAQHSLTTYPITAEPGDVFVYIGKSEYAAVAALFYDNTDTIIGNYICNSGETYGVEITAPASTAYVVFSSFEAAANPITLKILDNNNKSIASRLYFDLARNVDVISKSLVSGHNMVDQTAIVSGYINNATHAIVAGGSYRTTGFIYIGKAGSYVKHINNPAALATYADRLYIYESPDVNDWRMTLVGEDLTNGFYRYDIPDACVGMMMMFSSGNSTITDIYIGEGNTAPSPIPGFERQLNSRITIDYSQIRNAPPTPTPLAYDYNSMLTGKTIYYMGDSATHGDFSSITPPVFDSGIYAGELKVYPFYIGNRTNMIVKNIAVNGATAATIPGGTNMQWSANDNYKTVGADADYIIIWLGANDMWQNVPIGDVTSTDPTTFYGAYNVILSWLIANRPYAKIGIVASYWCTASYANAVKAIGARYGIPVLNYFDDPDVPVSVGSRRPDVASSVKNLRSDQYVVSASNTHGNAKFHELISYYIETWLKTL